MPPLHPGDPDDGHGHEGLDEDDVGFVPPLPPEDRLWRHPSEVAREQAGAGAPRTAAETSRPRTAAMLVLAGMVGASLSLGAVALLGGFDERVIERRVTTSPVGRAASVLEGDVASVTARTAPAVAALHVHRDGEVRGASAVVLRSDGVLLTDASAVAGARRVDVVLEGGPVGPARVLGVDPVTEVAVLAVEADDLRAATLGRSGDVAVGQRTVTVGAIADGGWRPSVSTGVVSATGQRLHGRDGTVRYGMLVVDKPFATGTLGGAVVDAGGAVIGLASHARDVDGRPGSAVVIPIDLAHHVADQILSHGEVRHVWLGLHGTDLDADAAAAAGLDGGAVVEDVVEGGPAAVAGLRAGDVVVTVDDEPTPSMAALIAILQLCHPGDVVALGVHRDGSPTVVEVALEAKPADRGR